MGKVLDDSVSANGDLWDFQCPGVQGSPCGDRNTGRPFHSDGWPTKKSALARGAEHFAEHKGEGVMQELDAFRREHGIVVTDDGVKVEDI